MASFEEDLQKITLDIEKLKSDFDQYFMGLTKVPPLKQMDGLDRTFRTLETQTLKSFANKFRLQTIRARYNTHKNYWTKILRAVEDGTFVRGKDRILKPTARIEEGPAAPPSPPAKGAGPKGPATDPLRQVYEEYVRAKSQLKEDVSQLTYEKLSQTLSTQASQIKQKYGAKEVEFKVVVEGGKAKLKAIPKV